MRRLDDASGLSAFAPPTPRPWHVGVVPCFELSELRMGKRPAQVTPYPRLMTQILRLAVARVESGENAEDLGGSLRTHQGIERDELAEIEITLGDAPALRVAAEQIILDHLRHLHPGIL